MPTMALKGCKTSLGLASSRSIRRPPTSGILRLLDKPAAEGFARWTGPLLAEALGDVDVQYVWRFLRSHKIDLVVRKYWCESNEAEIAQARRPQMLSASTSPRHAKAICRYALGSEKPSMKALDASAGLY